MKQKTTSDGTKGGLLKGKPHYDKNGQPLGGIKAVVTDAGGKPVELEGGEVIINKEASKKYWRELSRINQSAGNGVPIGPPAGADEDPEEYKDGGNIIEFNPNHVPNKWIVKYATEIKSKHPEIWKLGGNIFGNEAYKNLLRVSERGYWLDSEKWMYIKWRSYVARHKKDFRIEGVVAMLKWCDKVDKGWAYMKDLIDEKIKKIQEKSGWKHKSKMSKGGSVDKSIEKMTIQELMEFVKKHDPNKYQKMNWFTGQTTKGLRVQVKSWYDREILKKMNDGGNVKNYAFVESVTTNGTKVYKLYDHVPTNKEVFDDYKKVKDENGNPITIKHSDIKIETFTSFNRDTFLKQANKVAVQKFGSEIDDLDELIFSFDKNTMNVFAFDAELENDKEVSISVVDGVIFIKEKTKMKGGGSVSKTPAPASERIKGSKTNPKGTAKDAESGEKIKFDDNIVASIQSLIDEHNEKHPSKKISLAVAKAVVRRGMGAYSSSHRPTITGNKPNSRTAWGLARLKAFIYKAQTGKSKSGKYSQDNDLFEDLSIKVAKYDGGGNVDENVLKVSKYVLERHPKKGDVIEGGKANGYEIKKIAKLKKHYGISYELWLSNGSNKRIVLYFPKTKSISDFRKLDMSTTKGQFYVEWNDKTIEGKMATGGNVFKDDRDGTTYFVEKRPDGIWTIFSEGPQWSRRDEYQYGFASEEDAIDIAKLHAGITTEDDPEAYFMRTQYGNGGELAKGIKAEYEHAKTISKFKREGVSTKDVAISIAKDHLKEDPKYYSKLEQMEGQKFEEGGLITNNGGAAKVGDIGVLTTRKGNIQIQITNITEKWVIFNDLTDGNKRKDNPIDKFIENYQGAIKLQSYVDSTSGQPEGGVSHATVIKGTPKTSATKIPASQGGSKKIKEKFEEPEVTFNPTLDYQKLFIDFLDKENTKHWSKISKTEFVTDIIQNFIEATDEIDGLSKESIKVLKESINE